MPLQNDRIRIPLEIELWHDSDLSLHYNLPHDIRYKCLVCWYSSRCGRVHNSKKSPNELPIKHNNCYVLEMWQASNRDWLNDNHHNLPEAQGFYDWD